MVNCSNEGEGVASTQESTMRQDEKFSEGVGEMYRKRSEDHGMPESSLELSQKKLKESPCRNLIQKTPPRFKKYVRALDKVVQEHFPPLDQMVAKDVEFRGINALEFFEVFFSDDAPYSMKEFQRNRGDVDIEYGQWKRRSHNEPISFHLDAKDPESLVPFPTSSRKERTQTFKTLTKSYFGPAYACATKTERVTKLSSRLVIMESKTELSGIPYCDRFFVLERWNIESFKDSEEFTDSVPYFITTKLSVSVQVFMLRSCSFESQIKSKSLAAVRDVASSWSEKAKCALELTLKQKQGRIKNNDDRSIASYRSHTTNGSRKSGRGDKSEFLMKIHEKKLKKLEEKVVSGDVSLSCIEIQHCPEAGEDSAFAEVLNPNGGAVLNRKLDRPKEISFPLPPRQKGKSEKRGVLRHMRGKSLTGSW